MNESLPLSKKQNTLQQIYPWLIAVSGFLILMVVNGLTTTTLTVYDKTLENEIFGGLRDQLKFKEVVANLTSTLLVFFSGMLIDKLRAKRVMLVGIALLSATLYYYSLVQTKTEVYIAHLLLGLSLILGGSIPTIILVSSWFKKYKGASLGIALAGTSAGGIFFPQIIQHFVKLYDWRTSFQILAIFPLVLFFYALLVIRNSPQEMGILPVGEAHKSKETNLLQKGMLLKEAMKTRTFWLVCLCGMFGFFSIVSLITNTFLHTLELGYSEKQAAFAISLYFGIAMIGKFLISAFAEKVNKFWLIRICFMGLTLGSLSYALIDKSLFFWAVGLTAISWGGMYTMYNVITVSTFGLKDAGKINGIISLCESFGSFAGPAIAGLMYMAYHSYQNAFLLVSCLMAVATVLSFFFKNEMTEQEG